MNNVTKSFGVVAIIAILALATISGSIGQADAEKAKGNHKVVPPKSYGHKNAKIVCGGKLCSSGEHPDPINEGRAH